MDVISTAMRLRLHTDAGLRPARAGHRLDEAVVSFVISGMNGEIVREGAMSIGPATVNEAEYSGVILGLYNCHVMGADEVEAFSDSRLIVCQINGDYKLKAKNLLPYRQEVVRMANEIGKVTFIWIPREKNKHADSLTRTYSEEA